MSKIPGKGELKVLVAGLGNVHSNILLHNNRSGNSEYTHFFIIKSEHEIKMLCLCGAGCQRLLANPGQNDSLAWQNYCPINV